MVQKFEIQSFVPLLAQPLDDGSQYLYARSSNAADTANLTLSGVIDSVVDSDTHALLGNREVLFGENGYYSFTAAILAATQAGTVKVYAAGTSAIWLLFVSIQPANNDTIQIGLTGFLQTYTFKTSLTGAANEVKIGADVSATAANLKAAINAASGSGTTYGTGTTANAYFSSTAVSASLVTITDRIRCLRQIPPSVVQSVGATIGISQCVPGVDGTLLAILQAGDTSAFNHIILNSEDLLAPTLPPLLPFVTKAIRVGGKPCTFRFKIDVAGGDPVGATYETSTDGVNWATGLTSIEDLTDYTVGGPQFVHPDEINIEYVRLNIGANSSGKDIALDACVIS